MIAIVANQTKKEIGEGSDDNVEEDDRRGYSVRGLENEVSSKRRIRKDIYREAKYTVFSIQEEITSYIEAIPDGYSSSKKSSRKKNKEMKNVTNSDSNDDEKEECFSDDGSIDTADVFSSKFRDAVQRYHDIATNMMAQRYNGICQQHTKDAMERVCGMH